MNQFWKAVGSSKAVDEAAGDRVVRLGAAEDPQDVPRRRAEQGVGPLGDVQGVVPVALKGGRHPLPVEGRAGLGLMTSAQVVGVIDDLPTATSATSATSGSSGSSGSSPERASSSAAGGSFTCRSLR